MQDAGLGVYACHGDRRAAQSQRAFSLACDQRHAAEHAAAHGVCLNGGDTAAIDWNHRPDGVARCIREQPANDLGDFLGSAQPTMLVGPRPAGIRQAKT